MNKLLLMLLQALTVFTVRLAAQSASSPNLILILADDLGYSRIKFIPNNILIASNDLLMNKAFCYALLLWLIGFCSPLQAVNYYVHPEIGRDDNFGTSINYPFKTLERAGQTELQPGDTLWLAGGFVFKGTLELKNRNGSPEHPIVIQSYAWGNHPEQQYATINAAGHPNGILIENSSYITVQKLQITANGGGIQSRKMQDRDMRCGILVTTSQAGNFSNIQLLNLKITDIFFEEEGHLRGKDEVRTANGTQQYGWGIRFINQLEDARLSDLTVNNCTVYNVAHTGIKFTGRQHNIQNIRVFQNEVQQTGGPGVQMSGIANGHIHHNYISHSGSSDDSRKWGRGSGLWTWGSTDVVIEHNYFLHARGPGDSAGCHIDFNCKHVVVQYNFSADNAGGFCEILGNNYNCAYRYNISVNDGHRIKGQNGAFQEGKLFWLSGYNGSKRPRKGPFNSYFYNNTIFVKPEIVAKIAVDKASKGALIANNIFFVMGESTAVKGDQYNPETEGSSTIENIVFSNNLFLNISNWPKEVLIQDSDPRFGDPGFINPGGGSLFDYIPTAKELIYDQGIPIDPIPGDPIGLKIGLKVERDILGNPIQGRPDMGAVEMGNVH